MTATLVVDCLVKATPRPMRENTDGALPVLLGGRKPLCTAQVPNKYNMSCDMNI